MVHVYRYVSALVILLGVFCAYVILVAPWIAPPKLARAAREVAPAPALGMGLPPELAKLFPEDAWERRNPKIVETEQCTLLIQDYVTRPDGRLELTPCTLIFRGSGEAAGGGRPVVLQAPKAELVFNKPFDVARGEFGQVEKGTLSGEIRIYSPPTQADGRDAFTLQTRSVWLDRQSIRTANEVEFRYGESSGRGRDLEISLLQPTGESPRRKGRFRGVHAVSLKRLDYLRLAMPGGDAVVGPLSGPLTKKAQPTAAAAPLQITCAGEFAFEVARQRARFQDQVVVQQAVAGAEPDALRCDELLLDLSGPKDGQPAKSGEEVLAGRLSRIIALGGPVVIESPSRGIRGDAGALEYSLREPSIHLKADPERQVPSVSLRQFGQHLIAPEVRYEMPKEGKLGTLFASGPGELRLVEQTGQRGVVTARWQQSLKMQPQDQSHVISVRESASVEMQGMGRFEANELHVWVQEKSVPTEAAHNGFPSQAPRATTSVVPERLLAIGKVRMASPSLDLDTGRLETWFMHLPAAERLPQHPRGIDTPIREPVARVSFAEEGGPEATISGARPTTAVVQQFHVSGDVVRTQLVVRGGQFEIEDLSIRGHAQVDEVRAPQPQLVPLRVRGDFLEVRGGTRPDATAEISGFPAEVAGRGMSLAGSKIEMSRAKNEVRINGAGEAKMPMRGMAAAGLVPLPGGASKPPSNVPSSAADQLHLLWQQDMLFDGLTARFTGEVQVRTALQTAHMPALEATLNRRLSFGALGGGELGALASSEPLGLARVLLDGLEQGVHIESRGFDEMGAPAALDQLQVRAAVLDQLSGSLHAQGPGWVNTVRRQGGVAVPGQPALPGSLPHPASLPPAQAARALQCVHVAFERELVGDMNQRWIEFRQDVRTTYSPANDFGDVIVADPLEPLAERMVLMRSETLRITDTSFNAARSFELRTDGGTKVEARDVFVDAPRVSYASDKEALIIEGDGRVLAKLFSQKPGQPGSMEGQRFWYNLRTGELKMDAVNIQFGLGAGIKLPLPGGR